MWKTRMMCAVATGMILASALAVAADPAAQAGKAGAAADGRWLRGSWTFDETYTLKKQKEQKAGEGIGGIVVAGLVNQLKGSKLKFTEKDVVFTLKDGNGKAYPFDLVDADDETVSLKDQDGKVTAYHREGDDRFWISSTGNVNAPFYYKKGK